MIALGQISLMHLYGDAPSLPAIVVASGAVDDGRAQPARQLPAPPKAALTPHRPREHKP